MARNQTQPRREEILEVALRRFSKYGYSETSTRQICADLGLAHSAVYNHFKSKEEILLAIEEREVLTMQAGLEALLEMEKDSSPQRRAFLAIRFTFHRTIASREAWRLSIEALRSFKPKNRVAAIRRRDKYQAALQALVHEARGATHTSRHAREPDDHLGTLYLFGICDGMSRWFAPGGELSEDYIIDHAARWVMRGLQIDGYEA